MRFHVLTLFPEMVESVLGQSILGRAAQKGLVEFRAVNIRSFTSDRHNRVDDYTYGGGAGMLMQAQPVFDCCCSADTMRGSMPALWRKSASRRSRSEISF